jgi:ParB/RepB/Spo0J family partition protein
MATKTAAETTVKPAKAPKGGKTSAPANLPVYNPGDVFEVEVSELRIDDAVNKARLFPVTDEEIETKSDSIGRIGQLHPVIVRPKGDDEKHEIVDGLTRAKAIERLNRSAKKGPPLKVKCILTDASDLKARLMQIEANSQRSNASPADQMHNVAQMRGDLKMTDKQICNSLNISITHLKRLAQFATLDRETIAKVHRGEMNFQAALLLVGVDGDTRQEVRQDAEARAERDHSRRAAKAPKSTKGADGQSAGPAPKVKGPTVNKKNVKEALRSHQAQAGAAIDAGPSAGPGTKPTKAVEIKVSRNLKDFREWLRGKVGPGEQASVRAICLALDGFLDGSVNESSMDATMESNCLPDPKGK